MTEAIIVDGSGETVDIGEEGNSSSAARR